MHSFGGILFGDAIETIKQKVAMQTKPADSKYFTTTKKGELFELKAELNSDRREKRKDAVKKVIAHMTVGKDVSSLFADVINCMQTENLELKKLVYLYLMNYAKTQPDTAIMAVNTFMKDCDDPNPLIRALAVRTMGCIRVEKITEYLCGPLRKCLKDEDPYVRKTAAVCVAKLYDIDAQLVEDGGFLESLKDLICDSNPMVVANAVAAITEILESSTSEATRSLLRFDGVVVNKLLAALNECTEWGQVFILDAIADYTPADDREAQSIMERVTPRLAHANAAVVLSTVKVIMKMLELVDQEGETVATVTRKLAPPLVTLLSAEPEIQYVALRNISLIVQKRKDILKQEMKVFFVKYNDPIYVKLEKLDIMIRLISPANIGQVLAELKEYAKEVDVDFVRKAVRAIGRCAIKIQSAAERCVSTLIELIQTKVNYVVQEAIVVIKDIFRKYPNTYESIISILCENLDTLDEPEARASMIWIIGEYAERIDNADELLESFLDGFQDENPQVQLQLLTAIVKLFLKRPSDTQELVQTVLGLATQESDNPDLRDRGYIYWRLLSTDPAAAKEVVLAEKPLISEETDLLEPTLLDELICHLASLASVYHRPPSSFVEGRHVARRQLPARSGQPSDQSPTKYDTDQRAGPTVIPTQETLIGDLLDLDFGGPSTYDSTSSRLASSMVTEPARPAISDIFGDGMDDLLPMGTASSPSGVKDATPTSSAAPPASAVDTLADIFGDLVTTSAGASGASKYIPPLAVWLDPVSGKGLEIQGTFRRDPNSIIMKLLLTNNALSPMTDFAIQFNRNSFGLAPAQPLQLATPLMPYQSVTVELPLRHSVSVAKCDPLMKLQVALKNNVSVFYFNTEVPLHVLFIETGELGKQVFVTTWKAIPSKNEQQFTLENISLTADQCTDKLQQNNIFTKKIKHLEGQDVLYSAMKTTNDITILAELKIQPGNPTLTLSLKSFVLDVYPFVRDAFEKILTS